MKCFSVSHRVVCAGLVAGIMMISTGCGDSRPNAVPVSGQVLMDGQPLAAGVPGFVQVVPAGGRAASGPIDPQNGTFTLTTYETNDGVIPGTHPVAVIVNVAAGEKMMSLIPEQYADPSTSGLTITVDKPTTDLKIELTGGLRKPPANAGDTGGDVPAVE